MKIGLFCSIYEIDSHNWKTGEYWWNFGKDEDLSPWWKSICQQLVHFDEIVCDV